MPLKKTIAVWMAERGMALPELAQASGLERRILEAIAANRYLPSPEQRERLCAALGVPVDEVVWGHQAQVEHMYGHGPQFGRTP